MDEFIYKKSMARDLDEVPFLERTILNVADQENGAYNGQIRFDCSGIQSSQRFVDWSQAFIEIPFVVSLVSSISLTSLQNSFMMGLKNGTHQLIDNLQVKLNNTTVVEQQSFLNLFVSYKLMTSFSVNDSKKHGATLLFSPDSPQSSNYSLGTSENGSGVNNNRLVDDDAQAADWVGAAPREALNEGALQRFRWTSRDISALPGSVPGLETAADANRAGITYFSQDAGVGAARVYQLNILATIRLKDLSDFFAQMPLVRGAYMRLVLGYNSSRCVITGAGATMVNTSNVQLSGNTNPIMVPSAEALGPTNLNIGAAGVHTFECGVLKTSVAAASGQMPQCNLYVPSYVMDPDYEQSYLSLHSEIDVVYKDIFVAQSTAIAAGGQFNTILTNGIDNPKRVVVLPFFNAGAGNNATLALDPLQSPTDSSPATTSPKVVLDNYQIQVSGKNIFDSSEQYDFDQFLHETVQTGIHGGLQTGLSSGLVDANMFQNNYRYYTVDIARRFGSDKGPKSIRISGKNSSTKIIDLYAFIEYEKKIRIDTSTGAISKSVI
jgi:hypothetical protein